MRKILFVCHGRISVRTSRPSSAGLPEKLSKEDYNLVEELQDQASIAQCEENECHFKIGFSAGLLVQQEAVEQMKEMGTTG